MIDHVLGRPSVKFRKIQVLGIVSFWLLYLAKGDRYGPPSLRRINRLVAKYVTPWQTAVITLLYLYVARNFGKLVGLECPEPLANLYTQSYFRATWVTTALDAGFWTAMRIRKKWIRDLASVIFSAYYLLAAEQADEKVRKIRGALTIDHLRVSWNKGKTPYLAFLGRVLRPKFMRYPPRAIRIPRPANSDFTDPVNAWLYFDGPLSELKNHSKIVLDIPGGGFVAMEPRTNDDKLFAWAGRTGFPVLSLDYKKAPEYPYPYAIHECFDVYQTLIASRGRCIGFSGETMPKVILTGDSAGGNLAAAVTIMIVEAGSTARRQSKGEAPLPIPDGLVLVYPGLDMNIVNWLSEEQMSLIKDRRMRKTNARIVRRKSMQYTHLAGTPHHSDDDVPSPLLEAATFPHSIAGDAAPELLKAHLPPPLLAVSASAGADPQQQQHSSDRRASLLPLEPLHTRLAMSSAISYFNDRVLSPEMMRAMIILYIGPHNRPDFARDYLLSPVLAPDEVLARFPKTFFLTGERDPLVDDTIIMAGRLRRAKADRYEQERRDAVAGGGNGNGHGHGHGAPPTPLLLRREFDEKDYVEVSLIPGISHGFLQFVGLYPEGWKFVHRCGHWFEELFAEAERREREADGTLSPLETPVGHISRRHQAQQRQRRQQQLRATMESSGEEDRPLEMMSMSKIKQRGDSIGGGTPPTTATADGVNGTDGTAAAAGGGAADERRTKEKLLREQFGERSKTDAAGLATTRSSRSARSGSGSGGASGGTARRELAKEKRQKSMVTLASEDDLMHRRMLGLAGSLASTGDDGTALE